VLNHTGLARPLLKVWFLVLSATLKILSWARKNLSYKWR